MRRERWHELCARLGCPSAGAFFDEIVERYGERSRHYHTGEHVSECLQVFDEARGLADRPDEVEFAIWLHDVIYVPRKNDNEERSASFAAKCLAGHGLEDVSRRIVELILATRHSERPAAPDQTLIVDVDLHVLGAAPQRYAEFEDQVRREYRWVPKPIFDRKRAEILEQFLGRDPLFMNPWFQDRYEDQARSNLRGAIDSLRGGTA